MSYVFKNKKLELKTLVLRKKYFTFALAFEKQFNSNFFLHKNNKRSEYFKLQNQIGK